MPTATVYAYLCVGMSALIHLNETGLSMSLFLKNNLAESQAFISMMFVGEKCQRSSSGLERENRQ